MACTNRIYNIYDGTYFSRERYTADGATTDFTFSYPYLSQSDFPLTPSEGDVTKSKYINVYIDGTLLARSSWWMTNSSTVRIITAPADGVCVTIKRWTKLDEVEIIFVSGERYTSERANLQYLKQHYIMQEIVDMLMDSNGVFTEAQGGSISCHTGTGDNSETDFPLGEETGLTNTCEILVTLNGVTQHTSTYSLVEIDSISNVRFDTAPPTNVAIQMRVMSSVIGSDVSIGTGAILENMYGDCSITDDNFFRIFCIDDLATEANSFFVWDEASGGPSLNVRKLTYADIVGFHASVRENRLDQMATPTANVAWGNKRLTGLAEPVSSSDAVTKNYIDTASGLVPDEGTLTLSGVPGTDNVTLSASPSRIDLVFDTLVLTADSEQYDGQVSFWKGTGTETRRIQTTSIINGDNLPLTIQCQFDTPSNGFTITINAQNNGNYSGDVRYVAWP